MSVYQDVVAGVVCPWCCIGKRRLEKALAIPGHSDVAVRSKPFEWNPGAHPAGMLASLPDAAFPADAATRCPRDTRLC
jgi:predicted DsbA family dithiol-disulfide isomerase